LNGLHESSFRALGVSDSVAQALAARDIHAPFPIQDLVIPAALDGGDILAMAPTGSGKTLAFALPLVERMRASDPAPSALILVPTRELCAQVADVLHSVAGSKGLRVATAYGGAPMGKQIKDIKGAHVVVATPGRLQDLVERRVVSLDDVKFLVLDEADRMLDMGFKPQVDRLVRRTPRERQTMFFSATLDGEIGELARQYTTDPARFDARPPREEPSDIEHRFVSVTHEGKVDALIAEVEQAEGLTLVFVRTKRGADRLVSRLLRKHVSAAALHGDMPQRARERALAEFHGGKVRTLVATDVAARGLDLSDVSHVINFDPPDDHKSYVHRVGRTGRAGKTGTGVTFVTGEQQADVSRVASAAGHREQFEETGMKSARAKLLYTSRRGRRSRW
jgi:superfamily II DNA/RNA helicase